MHFFLALVLVFWGGAEIPRRINRAFTGAVSYLESDPVSFLMVSIDTVRPFAIGIYCTAMQPSKVDTLFACLPIIPSPH